MKPPESRIFKAQTSGLRDTVEEKKRTAQSNMKQEQVVNNRRRRKQQVRVA